MTDGERPSAPGPDAQWRAAFDDAKTAYLGDRECAHVDAARDSHSCPACGGTLRRCCMSLVGNYEHLDGCPEVARRSRDAA